MLARSRVLLCWLVCAPACRGPDIAGATETGGGTTDTSGLTDPSDPTDAKKFDLPPHDLPPPPPPLDCDMRPDIPLETDCGRRFLNWPAPFLHWYELIYACTDDKPDTCPKPDSAEAHNLLIDCESCYVEEFEGLACGPDPMRGDRCCYWAIAEINGCPE